MVRLTFIWRACALSTLLLALHSAPADAAKPRAKPVAQKKLATPTAGALYATRAEVMLEADAIAERRALDRAWVRQAIGGARQLPQAARWVLPPPIGDRKSTRLNSSHLRLSRMPSSA